MNVILGLVEIEAGRPIGHTRGAAASSRQIAATLPLGDGSLTLYFADEKPANASDGNWLPTPKGSKYRLTFRYYGPIDGVANGTYFPPPLVKSSN